MQGSKQQDVISNNKEGFSSKIAQKIIEITEPMPDGEYICMRFNSHQKSITLKLNDKPWFFYTNSDDFNSHGSGWNRIANDHYERKGTHVLFMQLESTESTFLNKYIYNCKEQAKKSVLFKKDRDDCGERLDDPAHEPAKRFTSKEMLKNYFKYFNKEYELFLKIAGFQAQTPNGQLVDIKKGDIKIFKGQVTSFRDFIEAVEEIVDKTEVQGKFIINVTFDYVETGSAVKDKISYIKLKYGKYIQFIVVTDYINDDVKSLLRRRYIECNLCMPNSHYECRKEDEYIQFHYYKFEGNSDELNLARKYILGNTPLHSNNTGKYKGNRKEVLEYFYNSTQQFCQNSQKKSVGTLVSERNDLIRKNQTKAIDNFIEQIGSIILEHIPDGTILNIAINTSTQITSGNKIWIIAHDSEYSHFHGYRSNDNNYNITKSELTISNPVHRLIKAKGLMSKKLKDRAETCKYLSELSQELNRYTYNELADCNKISTTEINYNNNNTQAAYIGLGLSSTLTTTLLPLYNYTVGDKSIDTRNLPRICNAGNTSALQQNTTDIIGYDSSEDNDTNIMVAMLVSVFAALAIVGVLITYCKSYHQRRNLNRNPSIRVIRNRRELEDLERGDGQLQLEERERLSVQGEDAQQLSSASSEAGAHLSSETDNEVTSSSSSSSNSIGSSVSSRSGTVSKTRSSTSIKEDGRSDSEEVRTDNSQRSPSPANAPQKSPGTLVQNVGGGSRPSWPTSVVGQVVGCLRNSC